MEDLREQKAEGWLFIEDAEDIIHTYEKESEETSWLPEAANNASFNRTTIDILIFHLRHIHQSQGQPTWRANALDPGLLGGCACAASFVISRALSDSAPASTVYATTTHTPFSLSCASSSPSQHGISQSQIQSPSAHNISLLEERFAAQDLTNMRCIPIWRAMDTPLRCLYRIYEAMAARETYAISPEVEYFGYQSRRRWSLDRIPDPCDPDPVRYAILASITEELAKGFNWRLSLGMRRVKSQHIYRKYFDEELPPFTPVGVDMITDLPSDFLDSSGRLVLEEGGDTPTFAARNIMTGTRDFYTV
ncbi:uncharacterized protein PGRI_055260 [Penicillium griseofulvum]|uniref:Uncharacterized protein n=1 Tax=Penicillium patulum TaxID=5078 RepID=A0A135LCQ7_PENPA|nr:uncharacterized protein PGRI_055260 [Penicillium griseofulvum]KXG46670.1 hypothetical protein PGRI_055260 [Penicillium griseofulvum]